MGPTLPLWLERQPYIQAGHGDLALGTVAAAMWKEAFQVGGHLVLHSRTQPTERKELLNGGSILSRHQ